MEHDENQRWHSAGLLVETFENARDHASEPPQLMLLIEQMDQIFQREIFAQDFDVHPTACLLVMNAYTMLLSAVRQALWGMRIDVSNCTHSPRISLLRILDCP